MHVEAAPQVLPGQNMLCHQGVEAAHTCDRLTRRQPALRDGLISRCVEGGEFLQHQRLALPEVGRHFLPDVSWFVDDTPLSIKRLSIDERLRSCRLRDAQIAIMRASHAYGGIYDALASHIVANMGNLEGKDALPMAAE